MGGFEILEHTADVGIRATGVTLEEVFEQAAHGLLEITGARTEGAGDDVEVEVQGGDLGALLVDWLGEVLYLQDARDALVAKVEVRSIGDGKLSGVVSVTPRGEGAIEGTAVKAITYHQLCVEESEEGWVAEVFVDV